jgi:hypothetical protein
MMFLGASRWPPQIVIRYPAMNDFETTNVLLREIRDLQKAQLEMIQALQASVAAQHQDYVNEKTKWLTDREKIRQDQLAMQSRQIRAKQWVRIYMLGLFLIVAAIWLYRLESH